MPPVTLNQQQFQKLRPGGNYQSYLQFVATRRGVPVSSLTPGGGGGSSSTPGGADPANGLAGLAGYQPLTSDQIAQQAQSEISPIIAAVTGRANQQAAQQASQIGGLTQDYANELSRMNFASPYQSGEGQQAAVDAALQQSLTGQGTNLAGGLADRLKALQGTSGGAAVQQAAGQLSSQGQSIGNTQVASGSAALGNLIANQAAASDFGQKLPAVARLSGIQALGQSAAAQQQAISNATLQAESQVPSIVQDLTANQQTALANAVAAQQKQQSLGLNTWKAQQSVAQGDARLNSENFWKQQQHNLDVTKAEWQQSNADRNYGLSYSKFVIAEKKAAALARSGGITPTRVATMTAQADAYVQDMYQGVPAHVTYPNSSNGLQQPRIDAWKVSPTKYQAAIQAVLRRYPALGATGAIRIVNGYYQMGEGGRPANSPATNGLVQTAGTAITNPTSLLTQAGGFLPKDAPLKMGRADQGRDFQTKPGTPIVAPGDGVVVRIGSDPGGAGAHFGPSYPIVHFTTGPYAGQTIYIGHTVASLHPGQKFSAGTVLSVTQPTGPTNGGAPDGWAEIGFAPGGTPGKFGQRPPF